MCFANINLCTTINDWPIDVSRGNKTLGTRVSDDCELPCGYWDLTLSFLEEKTAFLSGEPSL